MWAGVVSGKNLHVLLERKKRENINNLDTGRASDDRLRSNVYRADRAAKTVRAMPTPPPISLRPAVQGVVPQAIRGGNPLQMLNPWAPGRYGTWVDHTSFDLDIPGKWN